MSNNTPVTATNLTETDKRGKSMTTDATGQANTNSKQEATNENRSKPAIYALIGTAFTVVPTVILLVTWPNNPSHFAQAGQGLFAGILFSFSFIFYTLCAVEMQTHGNKDAGIIRIVALSLLTLLAASLLTFGSIHMLVSGLEAITS